MWIILHKPQFTLLAILSPQPTCSMKYANKTNTMQMFYSCQWEILLTYHYHLWYLVSICESLLRDGSDASFPLGAHPRRVAMAECPRVLPVLALPLCLIQTSLPPLFLSPPTWPMVYLSQKQRRRVDEFKSSSLAPHGFTEYSRLLPALPHQCLGPHHTPRHCCQWPSA